MNHPLAGQVAPHSVLTDIPVLLAAYARQPDISDPAQRVAFGTSGHRGSALLGSFNEAHILAIAQAVAEYRAQSGILGPLFIGKDNFKSVDRQVFFHEDQRLAWFEEKLETWMGPCRGSGVMVKTDAGWKLKQYNLAILVPNDKINDYTNFYLKNKSSYNL